MIKRQMDKRWERLVREGVKDITIRDDLWPVGVPIQLFYWAGKKGRSERKDFARVMVRGYWTISILKDQLGNVRYVCGMESERPIYQREGFGSQEEMDNTFRKGMRCGGVRVMNVMNLKLVE